MAPQHVLIVGDYDHPDFAPVRAWLQARAQLGEVGTIERAAARMQSASVDLALFAQARPGRFAQRDVERLHRLAPVVRLAVLLGVWCEGEPRTGTPLAGVLRMYWHEWRPRLASLWGEPAFAPPTSWDAPRTALPGERTLAQAAVLPPCRPQAIAVRTRLAASYEALAGICRTAGWKTAWLDPRHPLRTRYADAVLWEGDVRQDAERAELARLATFMLPAPTIALLSFPRRADCQWALAAGAAEIVAKPFLAPDLIGQLQHAIGKASPHARHG